MVTLEALLVAHGISPRAAQAVAHLGGQIRRQGADGDRELAALVDADTGELLGGILRVWVEIAGSLRLRYDRIEAHQEP